MRDLGGYPTADRKHVKWKALIRSGDLNRLIESDLAHLASLSIHTDIDFRSIQEKKVVADRIPATVAQYIPPSIEAGDMTDMVRSSLNNVPKMLKQAYVCTIQNTQDIYREFLRIVPEEWNTPLLFHCSAGKDRTDIATVLLSGTSGVDRKAIVEDCILSAKYLKGKYDATVQAHPEFAPLTTVHKEYLEVAFQAIDSDHQGLGSFLRNQLGADIGGLRVSYTG